MLTDYFFNHGFSFFASGWTQFAGAFFVSFVIMMLFGRPFIRAMRNIQKLGQPISPSVILVAFAPPQITKYANT